MSDHDRRVRIEYAIQAELERDHQDWCHMAVGCCPRCVCDLPKRIAKAVTRASNFTPSPLFDEGGFLPPAQTTTVRIERVGKCPNGHPWFRIDGSKYVEHIVGKGDLDALNCPHSVKWDGGGR